MIGLMGSALGRLGAIGQSSTGTKIISSAVFRLRDGTPITLRDGSYLTGRTS